MASPTDLQGAGAGALAGGSFGSFLGPIGTLVGAAAGAGLGAFGAEYTAGAKAKALQYQASVAQMNAAIAQQNAKWATQAGEVKAQESGMQGAARLSQTKAIQGASGLSVNTGSNVDIRASEADLGKFNENTIRSNAAREAYGYRAQAAGDVAQAGLDMAAARTTKTAGDISAAGSILGGASSVSDKWYNFSKQGVPGFGGGGDSSGGASDFDQTGNLYG